jgi:hypothetical protein
VFFRSLAAALKSSIIGTLASNLALLLEFQRSEHAILFTLHGFHNLFYKAAERSKSFLMLVFSSCSSLAFSPGNLYLTFLSNRTEWKSYSLSYTYLHAYTGASLPLPCFLIRFRTTEMFRDHYYHT